MSAPEFSRLIAIEGITPDKVRKEAVEATVAECAALAKRFDLRELSGLKARLRIHRVGGGASVRLEGEFEADVIQTCVVSLLDVHSRVEGKFDTFFSEDAPEEEQGVEMSIDDHETTPEMITNGMLDLGEVVAQYLSLEIDPYPRAPGVSLAAQPAEVGAEVKNNPFAVLQGLKKTGEKPAAKKPAAKAAKPAAKPAPKAKPAAKAAKPAKAKKGKAK